MDPKQMREKREALGLSREKLARLMDISAGTVINWEKGLGAPDANQIGALSKALDWPISEMLAE